MFNLFSWLRSRAREAVLAGVGDALEAGVEAGPAELPESLRRRLAHTPAEVVEPATNGRKRKE